MNEILFLVEEAPEGGYTARALGELTGLCDIMTCTQGVALGYFVTPFQG